MIDVIAAKIAETIGVVVLHRALERAYTDKKSLLAALSCTTLMRKAKIRVSMAQILQLRLEDKYVLIASMKRKGQFAPIGGVVRYFPWISPQLKGEIHYLQQSLKGSAEQTDLRGFIQGKHFVAFLRWYFSGLGRERQTMAREICEELVETKIQVPAGLADYPEFRRIREVHEGPLKSPNVDYFQYRHFEVLRLEPEHARSAELEAFMTEVARKDRVSFLCVSEEEIRRGRADSGEVIADSAGYLFGNDRVGLEPAPFV
jgi:hypothetical protein